MQSKLFDWFLDHRKFSLKRNSEQTLISIYSVSNQNTTRRIIANPC